RTRRDVPLDPEAIGALDMEALIEGLPPRMETELERIKPYRRRAAARFVLARGDGTGWRVRRVPVVAFVQDVPGTDYRRRQRVFAEMDAAVTAHAGFQHLLRRLAAMVAEVRPGVTKLLATAHQVQTIARAGQWGA